MGGTGDNLWASLTSRLWSLTAERGASIKISMRTIGDLLPDLEGLAQESLSRLETDSTASFTDRDRNVWTCPWLRWRHDVLISSVQGIILMQDWWNECEASKSIESQVNYLNTEDFKYWGPDRDRTTYRLYNSKWKDSIWGRSPKWLVTNAVWGLRSGANSSGSLAANVHKAAFPVWANLLATIATRTSLNVVFAHSCFAPASAVRTELGEFLRSFQHWAITGRYANTKAKSLRFHGVSGKALFWQHPSKWRVSSEYSDGPPEHAPKLAA